MSNLNYNPIEIFRIIYSIIVRLWELLRNSMFGSDNYFFFILDFNVLNNNLINYYHYIKFRLEYIRSWN